VDKISKMRRTAMKLTEELGREPTDEELAMELQIPTSKVATSSPSACARPRSTPPSARRSDSSTFGEIVGDENAISPFESLQERNLNTDLHAMVDSLDEREAEIIKLRFGLDGRDELTLEEVGKKFKVTRERIRQLEYLAITKMRKASPRTRPSAPWMRSTRRIASGSGWMSSVSSWRATQSPQGRQQLISASLSSRPDAGFFASPRVSTRSRRAQRWALIQAITSQVATKIAGKVRHGRSQATSFDGLL
jgi:RNA polymerase sigma factor (sigma-70 family)